MSITLEFDEETLASLPLEPGEPERLMQTELACRFYAKGWLSFGQGVRMAGSDHYAFGVALAERGIPRQYGIEEAREDLAHGGRKQYVAAFQSCDHWNTGNSPKALADFSGKQNRIC